MLRIWNGKPWISGIPMGDADSFVLIRGMLREARHWGEFAGLLSRQFSGAAIRTPDLPGNGPLHHQTSPGTIAEMTDALRRQVPLNRPVDLIAISMGGMIALDWMDRFPEEVQSAVIINSSARPLSPFYRRLRWQSYPAIIKLLSHSKIERERDILELTSNRYRHDETLLENWRQWQRQYPVSSASARNQLMAAAKFRLSVKPGHPLLIVASMADRLVDYRCSLQLQRLWQTDYRQHPTAGHDLPLDEPHWLVKTISQWRKTVIAPPDSYS